MSAVVAKVEWPSQSWICFTVDGRHQLYAEDKLKTKSSFRTLPLIPAVRDLLLAQREKARYFPFLGRSTLSATLSGISSFLTAYCRALRTTA